jgi:hypothetical protein
VATVVKPLLSFGDERIQPSTYSVFVDSRLLLRRVEGLALPFSDDVTYIFDKQLEEAGLLVLNKVDLLSDLAQEKLLEWVAVRESTGLWRFQNSLAGESVGGWVASLQGGKAPLPDTALDIDYGRYGRGEAHMAWLDETLSLSVSSAEGRQVVLAIIEALLDALSQERAAIGHLKFVLDGSGAPAKISFTGLEDIGWQEAVPELPGDEIKILVNMRAETAADRLHQVLHRALARVQNRFEFTFRETDVEFFHPSQPKPTHRLE